MAVIAHVLMPGASREDYDEVRDIARWLEDPLGRFASERLGPAMAEGGIDVEPVITVHPAHEVFAPRG